MNSSLNLQKELEIDFNFLKKKKSYAFLQKHSPTNKWVNWINKQKKPNLFLKNFTKSIKEIEQSRLNKLYGSGYSKIHELKLVKIEIASAGKIKEWAEKILLNGKTFGEVTNANTLHYKTFKPHKGGLFCERIFGPLKDFECACGVRSKPTETESKKILEHKQTVRSFCPNCDVEYTWSVIRRYQLGYIQLVSPVSHIWFLKANPSYLSLLLDLRRSHLESIIYCTEAITLENLWKSSQNLGLDTSPAALFSIWQKLIQADQAVFTLQKNLTSELLPFSKYTFSKEKQKQIKKRLKFLSEKEKTLTTLYSLNNSIFLKNAIQSENQTKNLIETCEKIFKRIYKEIYFQTLDTTIKNSKYFEPTSTILFSMITPIILKEKEDFKCNNDFLSLLETFFQVYLISFLKKSFEKNSFDKNGIILSLLLNEQSQKNSFKRLLTEFLIIFLTKREWTFFLYKKKILKELNSLFDKQGISQTFSMSNLQQLLIAEKNLLKRKNKKILNLSSKINKIIQIENGLYYYSGTSIEQKSKKLFSFFEKNKKNNHLTSIKLKKFKTNNNFVKPKEMLFQIQSQLDKIYFKKSIFSFYNKKKLSKSHLYKKTFLFYFKTHKFRYSQIRENFFWIQNNQFSFNQDIIQQMNNSFILKKAKDNKKTSFAKRNVLISFNNKKNKFLKRKKEFFEQKQKSIQFKKLKFQYSFGSEKNLFSKDGYLLNSKIDKSISCTKKLKNDFYTISYSHLWAFNSDWKSFFYFNSAPKDFEDFKFPYVCIKQGEMSSQEFDLNTIDFFSRIATPLTGAAMVKKLLSEYEPLELKKMIKQHQNLIPKLNRSIRQFKEKAKKKADFVKIQKLLNKRDHIIRRLKLIRKFARKNVDPTSMILSVLPVLPPDLRPILKLQNQIAASDLNRLYQRILYRNERLKKFLKDPSTSQSFEMKYAQRLLQEAVDNLIQNGKGKVKPETNSRGQPLKSLSEILKGKQGRFRQYLLGKRVDYSGRSVIVVGPKLKIYECGLPKEMALELFLPFLIKRVLHYKIARTVIGAKNFLDSNKKFTWNLLNEIMKNHPVLLNRAPTLHRLGIQAFQPKLVEGRAILLHPLVCPAFNADFDGDQMAVHVPLTVEARAEAWTLMFSRNHLISPATGEPIILPSQDMVLGCYYLTSEKMQKQKNFAIEKSEKSKFLRKNYFSNFEQILNAYQLGYISLQSVIWIKWNGKIQFSLESFHMLEIRLNVHATRYYIQSKAYKHLDKNGTILTRYARTTVGRILMNSIAQKCIFS